MTERDDERWRQYAACPTRRLRNELVEANLGLAAHIARRFSGRGIDEDIRQVAFVALVKAVERFDVNRAVPFSAFAGRTIEGEIKRHFRDTTWTLRVPRSVKERSLYVAKLSDELAQELGRAPTVGELAGYLEISTDEVLEAMAARGASSTSSLDASEDGHLPVALGQEDSQLAGVQDAVEIGRLMRVLPAREREIVRLRFFEECSQIEIAERIGISQMHVSRLLQTQPRGDAPDGGAGGCRRPRSAVITGLSEEIGPFGPISSDSHRGQAGLESPSGSLSRLSHQITAAIAAIAARVGSHDLIRDRRDLRVSPGTCSRVQSAAVAGSGSRSTAVDTSSRPRSSPVATASPTVSVTAEAVSAACVESLE